MDGAVRPRAVISVALEYSDLRYKLIVREMQRET